MGAIKRIESLLTEFEDLLEYQDHLSLEDTDNVRRTISLVRHDLEALEEDYVLLEREKAIFALEGLDYLRDLAKYGPEEGHQAIESHARRVRGVCDTLQKRIQD
jgi:hypothetical protein